MQYEDSQALSPSPLSSAQKSILKKPTLILGQQDEDEQVEDEEVLNTLGVEQGGEEEAMTDDQPVDDQPVETHESEHMDDVDHAEFPPPTQVEVESEEENRGTFKA